MKATTLIVLGGLLFAGTATAADPQQAASAESGVKVGIDAKTGKLRPLSASESATLDAAARKQKTTLAKTNGKAAKAVGPVKFVAANGMTVVELDESHMVELHATIGADGKIVINHGGESQHGAPEAAHE